LPLGAYKQLEKIFIWQAIVRGRPYSWGWLYFFTSFGQFFGLDIGKINLSNAVVLRLTGFESNFGICKKVKKMLF